MSREIIVEVDQNRKIVNYAELVQFFNAFKTGRTLVIAKDQRKKSVKLNAYYWAVVAAMIQEALYDAGYDDIKDAVAAHEFMKAVLLKRDIVNKNTGEVVTVIGGTRDMKMEAHNEFVEECCRWASINLGINIPPPSSEYAQLKAFTEDLENE